MVDKQNKWLNISSDPTPSYSRSWHMHGLEIQLIQSVSQTVYACQSCGKCMLFM